MSGGQEPADQAHEFEVTPATPAGPRTALMMAGALAVLIVAVVGAYFAASASDDETEVDVAAPEATAEEEAEAEVEEPVEDDVAEDEAGESEEAEAEETEAMLEDVAGDAVDAVSDVAYAGFGGPNNVIHTDDGFVSIGWDANGPAVSRSADGTEWSSTPIVGIPAEGNITGIAEVADGFVAVVEVWPAYDEEAESEMFFGPPQDIERMLATSSDLVNWETSELPTVEVEENGFSHVAGIAASGDSVAILVQVEPAYIDEMQILFEAGLLTESDLESFCGSTVGGPDDPIIFETCDWEAQEELYMEFEAKMEAAETDEERMALEEEFFGGETGNPGATELLRLEPGDPLHTEILEGYQVEPTSNAPVVLAGTVGGTFTQTELPVTGYASSIAGTDAGFMAIVNDWESGTTHTAVSTDGANWSLGASLGSQLDVQGIAVAGDLMVATGSRWDSPDASVGVWTTSDLGATWNESDLPTELFGAYGMPLGGPAGVAISLDGSTEPYPEGYGMPENLVVTNEGYTLEILFQEDIMRLTAEDGTVVHEVPGIVNEQPEDAEIEGVVRFDGIYGSDVTFLDPATGEDLVSFGEAEFEAAYMDMDDSMMEMDFEEPPRRSEVWFSTDGISWTLLDSTDVNYESESWTALAGVGDDEVLMRTETWVEPPAELWAFEEENREPTDEEIEALDAWHAGNGANVEWRRIPVG